LRRENCFYAWKQRPSSEPPKVDVALAVEVELRERTDLVFVKAKEIWPRLE
jgi:hypothetical protein